MTSNPVNIAPIACCLSQLISYQHNPALPETIFSRTEFFALQVTIEFSRSGAIALMPLELPLQVDFLVEQMGNGERFVLGTQMLTTAARQTIYKIAIEVQPQAVGLIAEQVYRITALLKVGAIGQPAWMVGTIDGLMVQTY